MPPVDPVGSTLGRYKLERELGQGGMGVVHAAFDPNLERRVALKVLRAAAGTDDARKRLLNEARAMARLAHPNVVTVHEVDSANGRDYIAMELIEGQTLADWMRETPRQENEIIDAFAAAGRGLAAAHAAGMVHRDFKPHNILRHRNGRIAVTDFGLAREAMEGAPDPLAETRELRAPVTAVSGDNTPSTPLAGLTMTGSVLGTPAYMAPEQWSGGAVTPATDQFAFCVALWEALTGERPFKGDTVEQLREAVRGGPAKLDTTKIPRWLRPALIRGLDPQPSRRWPSMDALLGAMTRANRKSGLVWILGGAAAVSAALVLVLVLSHRNETQPTAAPACRAAILDVDKAWPMGMVDKLRKGGQRPAADLLDADVKRWKSAYDHACTIDNAKREPVLACLDGVLSRLDVLAHAVEPLAGKQPVDVGVWLVDPAVCSLDMPPRLVPWTSPQMKKTINGFLREEATPGKTQPEVAKQMVEDAKGDACASVYARYLAIRTAKPEDRETFVAEAAEESERCNDERVRAEIALVGAELALESNILSTAITSKVKLAELAAKRVQQPDVLAALDGMRCEIAKRADQYDEAIARAESAMKHYAERGRVDAEISIGLKMVQIKQQRGTLEDLASVKSTLEQFRARAAEKLGADSDTVREVDHDLADWQFSNGDVEPAVAGFARIYHPEPNQPSQHVHGKVVDEAGAPVAGASVVAGTRLGGNAYTIAITWQSSTRTATTGADGTFEIADAPEFGTIIAQAGALGKPSQLRSHPQRLEDNVTLRLEPTGSISGRIDLHGEPAQSVTVVAVDVDNPDLRYGWPSPVAADGKYEINGVPRKKMKVFPVSTRKQVRQGRSADVVVKDKPTNVNLDVEVSNRVVHVVVRSTVNVSIGNAAVLVMPGKVPSMTAKELRQKINGINERPARQVEGEHAPAPVVKLAKPGDMFATMQAPEGVATACAIALPADLADPQLGKKIDANLDKLKVECIPIPDKAEAVMIEVPPFPRLD